MYLTRLLTQKDALQLSRVETTPLASVSVAVIVNPSPFGPGPCAVSGITSSKRELAKSGVMRGRFIATSATGSSQTVCQIPVVRV